MLPFQLGNFDETAMMVKSIKRPKVFVPKGCITAGIIAPETITSTTLFLSIFLDGTSGPSFIILPSKKYVITDDVVSKFSADFKVRFGHLFKL